MLSPLDFYAYMELAKSIQKGNAPRQCRLCGRWYLHEQGDKTVYCDRIPLHERHRKTSPHMEGVD